MAYHWSRRKILKAGAALAGVLSLAPLRALAETTRVFTWRNWGDNLYAEPENIEDILLKIKFVMDEWNAATLKAKGRNGYLYAKEHFDRTVLANKYVTLLGKQSRN